MTTIASVEAERFNVNLTRLYETERPSLGIVWAPTVDQIELMRQELDADRLIRQRIAKDERKRQADITWRQKLADKGYSVSSSPSSLERRAG